jgi:hypothetical protein
MTQRSLHLAQILWPAFLVAGVLEMVVFSWVDPGLLRLGNWHPDTNTAYSLAFLVFWALVAAASCISHWLMSASTDTPQELLTHRLES